MTSDRTEQKWVGSEGAAAVGWSFKGKVNSTQNDREQHFTTLLNVFKLENEKKSLKTVIILFVLFAFALEAVRPVAVVPASLTAVSDAEAGVHLRQRVHSQDFMDLTEGQQPQSKL